MIQANLPLRRFLNSQHLYTGIRITAGVLIPAMVLYHFGQLGTMMGIPLGALFLALPDNPGPLHHRINGMVAGILINFLVVVMAGYSYPFHWLVGIEIAVFSFLFAMFAVYGTRADSIGLIALVAFVLAYGTGTFGKHPPIITALFFAAGGAWYALLSVVFTGIQPYRPVQQLLGEYLTDLGKYLASRAGLYDTATDIDQHITRLFPQQVNIQKHQNDLREMLFKTRIFIKESTDKGRRLLMVFLESTDLLERIITAQQDYHQLHKDFDDAGILGQYKANIELLGQQLERTGTAIQSGNGYFNAGPIDEAYEQSKAAFFALRNSKLTSANMEAFIRLRHILYSLADLSERIKRLQGYSMPGKKIKQPVTEEYLQSFVTHQDFSIGVLTANLSLHSNQFRHAIRLTIAMVAGYILSLLFPLGHSYWILLTIATILKPAFSTSRQRNLQRVGGTLIGVAAGFLTLFITNGNTAIFIVMLSGMLVAYTTLRINYLVSTAALTLYIVLSFHFLYDTSLNGLLADRMIDTLIGAVICIVATYFILPKWEHEQMDGQIKKAVEDNHAYFNAVRKILEQKTAEDILPYKLSRKAAFISQANLADGLQRMLDEPKRQQLRLQHYHQVVASNHMLTSYIASLAYYAGQHEGKYNAADLKPMLQYIHRQFEQLTPILQGNTEGYRKPDPFPVSKKVQDMLEQRKQELLQGLPHEASAIRHQISLMKSMTDVLKLISSVLDEQIRIFLVLEKQAVAA